VFFINASAAKHQFSPTVSESGQDRNSYQLVSKASSRGNSSMIGGDSASPVPAATKIMALNWIDVQLHHTGAS
jgi:hypothetical protein